MLILMSALFSYRRKIRMDKQKLKEIFEEAKQKTIDVTLELTVPTDVKILSAKTIDTDLFI